MLKSLGKAVLHFRVGSRLFICLRKKQIGKDLRSSVRPYDLGWFSCWCERPPQTD